MSPSPVDSKSDQVGMEPVHVTVVGGTGDGGMSTRSITTPQGQPNLVATFIPTALALGVRWVDTFLTVLLAVSGIGAVTSIDAVRSMVPDHVALGGIFEEALFYSFVSASFGLLKDIAVIVGKLKQKHPLFDV